LELIFDYNDLNTMFHADSWLEENYGCEFYKSANGNLMCSCPFDDHADSSPSFGIHLEKGLYKCFGCGREGSLINLVSDLMKINFFQAINIIANFEGLNLDNIDSLTVKNEKFKKALTEADNEENKKNKLILKATIIIKKIMKNDFEKADKMYKTMDDFIKEQKFDEIKDLINGCA